MPGVVLSDGVLRSKKRPMRRGACPKYLSACPILGPLGVEMLIRNGTMIPVIYSMVI